MTRGLIFTLFFLCVVTSYAQNAPVKSCDTVYLRNGKKLAGWVKQVEEFVHYCEQYDTNIYHRIGAWRVSYIRMANGKKYLFPPPERYFSTLRHHPLPSPLDKDTIVLKRGIFLSGKVVNIDDDYVHYTMANDKKNGYKVAAWKVSYVKYASGKVFRLNN